MNTAGPDFAWIDRCHFAAALWLIERQWWRCLPWLGWERLSVEMVSAYTGESGQHAVWLRRYRNEECLTLRITAWGAHEFDYEESKGRMELREVMSHE